MHGAQGTEKVLALMAAAAQIHCREGRMGMPQATFHHEITGDSAWDLVLVSGTQQRTQQEVSQLRSQLRAAPGKSRSSGCHVSAAREGWWSLPCQRCIPPAPWQQAEQLVQSGHSQKAP